MHCDLELRDTALQLVQGHTTPLDYEQQCEISRSDMAVRSHCPDKDFGYVLALGP